MVHRRRRIRDVRARVLPPACRPEHWLKSAFQHAAGQRVPSNGHFERPACRRGSALSAWAAGRQPVSPAQRRPMHPLEGDKGGEQTLFAVDGVLPQGGARAASRAAAKSLAWEGSHPVRSRPRCSDKAHPPAPSAELEDRGINPGMPLPISARATSSEGDTDQLEPARNTLQRYSGITGCRSDSKLLLPFPDHPVHSRIRRRAKSYSLQSYCERPVDEPRAVVGGVDVKLQRPRPPCTARRRKAGSMPPPWKSSLPVSIA